MSLNPFDNASEQAQKASEASEIVLANVEAISDDNSMVAVSNVGKDAKYPARLPRDIGIPSVGDAVFVNTASGGNSFVSAVVSSADQKVGETVDVSDSGTSVLENASELNFDTNLSVSESDGTATIDASGGDTSAIVDKYKHVIPFFDGIFVFQPTENNLFKHTKGYIADGFDEMLETVYDLNNDRIFGWNENDLNNFVEIPTSADNENRFPVIQQSSYSGTPTAIGYDPANDNVIGANNSGDIVAFDPADLTTTVWSSTTSDGNAIRQLDVTDTGAIYACSEAGTVYHFDSSGTEQNVVNNGNNPMDISITPNDLIYVIDYGDSAIRQYDASLTLQWSISVDIDSPRRGHVGSDNSIISSGDYGIERYDSTGSRIWKRGHEYTVYGVGVTPNGYVYAATSSNHMKIDESDGSVVYRASCGENITNLFEGVVTPRPAAYPNEWT